MKRVESIFLNMAMANLKVAMDRLRELLDENKFATQQRDLDWAGLCCSYSRCIHKIVWRDNVPKQQVRSEIIPLFSSAEKQVTALLDSSGIGDQNKNEITCYAENIRLRHGNLEQNYLNDVASCFPADVMEPRLSVIN